MISLKFNFNTPYRFRDALRRAMSLIGDEDVNNIWENATLKIHLSLNDRQLLDELKSILKDEMIAQFGPYCTYCHRYGLSGASFHIDHFVIKANKAGLAKFTYYHKNLVLSCIDCNLSKGSKRTFSTEVVIPISIKYKELPFSVFHPYIHQVGQHFQFLRRSIQGKSELASNYLGMIGYFDARQRKQILNQLKERVMSLSSQRRVRLIVSQNRRSK